MMKINLSEIDLTSFMVHPVTFCGIEGVLVQPQYIGTRFTQKNKIFRSSIWDKDGNLLSGGFPKFVNFSENPENFPVPTNLNGCKILEKMDGSLCICDYVNTTFSMRTRGTDTYKKLENYYDFEYCLEKYPKIVDYLKSHSNLSLLFEITTPDLKIVIDYGPEADFTLVGAVNKDDYSLLTQKELDDISKEIGVKRPKYYSFNSISELIETVQNFPTEEGVCLYSKGDQEIHKIKSMSYLKRHAFKANANYESTVDLFFAYGYPSYNEFTEKILNDFDWECVEMIRGHISNICDGMKEVYKIIEEMKLRVAPLRSVSRKEAAEKIFQMWGKETNRSGFAFKLLDSKDLGKEDLKKLLYQVTKN